MYTFKVILILFNLVAFSFAACPTEETTLSNQVEPLNEYSVFEEEARLETSPKPCSCPDSSTTTPSTTTEVPTTTTSQTLLDSPNEQTFSDSVKLDSKTGKKFRVISIRLPVEEKPESVKQHADLVSQKENKDSTREKVLEPAEDEVLIPIEPIFELENFEDGLDLISNKDSANKEMKEEPLKVKKDSRKINEKVKKNKRSKRESKSKQKSKRESSKENKNYQKKSKKNKK